MISRATTDLLFRLHDLRVNVWLEGNRVRFDEARVAADLVGAITSREAEIAEFLRATASGASPREEDPIEVIPRGGPLPSSFAQRRLWALHHLRQSSAVGNMQMCVALRGRLDVTALEWSLGQVIRRHESLRTSFALHDGELVQIVNDAAPLDLTVVDLSGEVDPRGRATQWAQAHANQPFDLTANPLLAAALVVVGPEEHVLSITLAHIIADGWSAGVLWRDLAELYRARVHATAAHLPELTIQYADYAAWQGERHAEQAGGLLRFWRETLADLPTLELPTDMPRPPRQTFAGGRWNVVIGRAARDRFAELGARNGCTLFMAVLAAFKVLLARYSGQRDIVVGTPVANRDRVEVEPLVGLFANTLVLRTDLSGDASFRDCLRSVRDSALAAFEHQAMPFDQLVDDLRPARAARTSPLFQVMCKTDGLPEWADLDGVAARDAELATTTSKYDLTLSVEEVHAGLQLGFEYCTDLFHEATIAAMSDHLIALIDAAVEDPDGSVWQRTAGGERGVLGSPPDPTPVRELNIGPGAEVYVAPRTEMEKAVAGIWQRVLGAERVGVHDHFYDLGGHSLLAMKVAYLIEKETGLEVMPTDLLLETLEQVAKTSENGATAPAEPTPPADVEVRPMFFGRVGAELFGVYHPPRSAGARDVAVLLCHGFGPEYIAAHGSMRNLADRFARAGVPALRFDFFGCGDSAGTVPESSIDHWIGDVATAARQLREVSGARQVCVVGLRLGATLAALAGANGHGAHDACVLWEPLVRGRDYLEEMHSAQDAWVRAMFLRRKPVHDEGGPQILGFELPPPIQEQIRALDLSRIENPPAERVLVVQNVEGPHLEPLRRRLAELPLAFEDARMDAAAPWVGEQGRTITHTSPAVLQRIVDWTTAAMEAGA